MTNAATIIERFMEQAGTEHPRFLRPSSSNIVVGQHSGYGSYDTDIDTVYSYGTHFPLARLMPGADGSKRGWWLLNGDNYSVTTSRHQTVTQSAAKTSGLPYMIVPQSAIERAGIKAETIRPVHILPDRWTWEPRTRDGDKDPSEWELSSQHTRNWEHRLPENRWFYELKTHHLGEALFTADYAYDKVISTAYTDDKWQRHPAQWGHFSGTAYFLSAFDANESDFGLYFLAQLPEGAKPESVAGAFDWLKPDEVRAYETFGSPYGPALRQGDVFAIASDYKTRELPGPSKHGEYVLGVNHRVTEVRVDGMGNTYGRGTMRHVPREWGRRPEHRRLKLGDGKTWYQLVRNTVPDGRSWSVGGNVD